jgi:hypothetical protein
MLKSIQQRDLDRNRWIKITMTVITILLGCRWRFSNDLSDGSRTLPGVLAPPCKFQTCPTVFGTIRCG